MNVYTVHEPPGAEWARADRIERAERVRFVGDGFNWMAALFAPFVLLAHKLYIGLAIYAVALAAVVSLLLAVDAQPGVIALAVATIHLVTGFEFGELHRSQLDHDGWADLGLVSGRTPRECERRFFESWIHRQPMIAALPGQFEAAPAQAAATATTAQPVPRAVRPPWALWGR